MRCRQVVPTTPELAAALSRVSEVDPDLTPDILLMLYPRWVEVRGPGRPYLEMVEAVALALRRSRAVT